MVSFWGSGQTEAELKVKAEQLFASGQYVEATPLFLHLLSLQPRDHDYNYKYGTCLLFNSYKKQDALRYLTYAAKDPAIDPTAYYFLGRAYHLDYQFNNAIREYQNYLSKAGSKGVYLEEAKRNMEMCANGKKLLSSITEIIVTRKTEISQSDFFRIYNLTNIGGSIIVGQDFQSKNDKKRGHLPLIHFPAGAQEVFFSSYGDEDQLDLYVVRRLPDGKFGVPQKIAGQVNTSYDEDYPYMDPSGKYLYFSSKGHNSMGGFDVFRARFDSDNNSFGQVENIDFAISSPDDDMFYMVDKEEKNAYFASTRQSQDGKIFVYEVLVDRVPIQLAVVKGSFNSSINPENRTMSVEVKDVASGRSIGTFKASNEGGYLITFPKGGKYEYHVRVEGTTDPFVSQVEIPYLKEFKPLKQKMVHEQSGENEQVRIVNLFNEEVEDAQAIIAQVLKERSNLNVNADEFDLESLQKGREDQQVLSELGMGRLSLREVAEALDRKSEEINRPTASNGAVEHAVNAKVVAVYEDVARLDKQARETVQEADQTESEVVQFSLLNEAKETIERRNAKLEQVKQLQGLEHEIVIPPQDEAEKQSFMSLSEQVSKLVEAGKEAEAMELLKTNKSLVKEVMNRPSVSLTADLSSRQKDLDAELDKLNKNEELYTTQIRDLEAEIRTLEEQKGNVKEKFRQEYQDQIDVHQESVEQLKEAREKIRSTQVEKANERKDISSRLEVLNELETYSGTVVTDGQVEQARKMIQPENARTLQQYVDKQLTDLVAGHPELSSGNTTPSTTDRIIASHNTAAENNLQEDDPQSTAARSRLIALNEQTLRELEEEQDILEGQLEIDPQNQAAAKQLQKLNGFAEKLRRENEELSMQSSNATETLPVYTRQQVLEEVYPDYTENIRNIENDASLTKVERLERIITEQEQYRQQLSLELEETEAEWSAQPTDATLQSKIEVLKELSGELETELTARKAEYKKEKAKEVELATAGSEYLEIVEALNDAYESQRSMLDQEELSEEERLEILEKITRTYISELEKQELAIQNAAGTMEENPVLKKALEEIVEIREGALEDLDVVEREQQVLATNAPHTKEDFINLLDASYAGDVASLNASGDADRFERLIDREKTLQQTIEQRMARNQKDQTETNRERIEQENRWLMEELQASIARTNDYLEAKQQSSVVAENPVLSEREKDELLSSVRTEVNEHIAQQLEAVEADLESLQEQQNILGDYERELQNEIAERVELPDPNGLEKKRIAVLREEVQKVQSKRRSVQASIDEIGEQAMTLNAEALSEKEQGAYREEMRSGVTALTVDPSGEQRVTFLREGEQQLKAYEEQLSVEIESKEQLQEQTPDKRRASELEILRDELADTQEQRRRFSVRIGELEQQAMHASSSDTTDPKELPAAHREQELKERLTNENLTAQERRSLEKELAVATEERMTAENPLLEERIGELAAQAEIQRQQLSETELSAEVTNYFDTEQKQTEMLQRAALAERNSAKRNHLLKEAEEHQVLLNDQLREVLISNREQEIREQYDVEQLLTTEQLESRKRNVQVEIGNITQELNTLREQREGAKAKERGALDLEIGQLENRRAYLQTELIRMDAELEQVSDPVVALDTKGMETALTYNEEREIAASAAYESYAKATQKVVDTDRQLKEVELALSDEQRTMQSLIEREVLDGVDNGEAIAESAEKIRRYSVEVGELNQEVNRAKTEADQWLPANEEERMKFQNLALRGVNPLKKAVLVTALVPLPAAGIEISAEGAATTYTESNPIPVNVENPTGLVYRVQVGAFAKPIPQDLFKEFTPVSGEQIPNTNITRYMAGFFNSSEKVVSVREQIRALGYSDAFVVAYCDGERISFGEARRLEASGECVPQGTNELLLDVATKTVQKLGLEDTTKTLKPVSEYSYHQAPGAAPAQAIELYEGLFFTVQIGVYNTPVSHDRLLKLEPLLTMRLNNGQIRYSCGMFDASKPAKVLEAEIRKQGIIDAFVTAYYKGKRISWQQAEEILSEQGNGILADFEHPDKRVEETLPHESRNVPVFDRSPIQTQTVKKPGGGLQIVSKKVYTEYPRDVVNRYNNKGVFYFDAEDGRVKSIVYDSGDQLPHIQAFKDDVDTVFYTASELRQLDGTVIVVRFENSHLPGDVADWMLRLHYRRTWMTTENGLELRIFDVGKEQLTLLQQEISVFGLESEVLPVKKEE